MTRRLFRLAAAALFAFAGAAWSQEPPVRILDDFTDVAAWQVVASDDVKASIRQDASEGRSSLCVDYDFGGVSGYVALRRTLPIVFAPNYEIDFDVRGNAAPNALDFKLADSSGENVWWSHQPDFGFTPEWRHVRLKKRHIAFAWGPSSDHELRRTSSIEFALVRGAGGKGSVCFSALSYRELPPEPASYPPPKITQGTDSVTLDFGRPREFGGIVLRWVDGHYASRYDVELSDDAASWNTVRHVTDGNGGEDAHFLPESESRYLRLRFFDRPQRPYAIEDIEVKDVGFGASANTFFQALAKRAPRGTYPRSFTGEQSYWTVLGVDGGSEQSLLSEDGALDLGPRYGSLEPFLLIDGKLVGWAGVRISQSLADGYLPIPSVAWHRDGLSLRITAFGAGDSRRSQVIADYALQNRSGETRTVTLALAARPFQVNPPTQFLNTPGGVAPIRSLSWDGNALAVNGSPRIYPLRSPDEAIAADFDAGNIAEVLLHARPANRVQDETGFASGALLYRFRLAPGADEHISVVVPLDGEPIIGHGFSWVADQQARVAAEWREKLNRVSVRLPAAPGLADAVRSALAQILVSRKGPELRPGTRSYARSWIRDGAMMSDALLRLGHPEVVKAYIDWFASRQFASGKVPCCVDARGPDPVVENDSPGEFLHLIAEYWLYTADRDSLVKLWPRVDAAARYMDELRLSERTRRNQTPGRSAFYGLMPPSISHEGYSDRPAYSYWDDFWALAGYDGAVTIAKALHRDRDTVRFTRQRDEFAQDLGASVRHSIEQHHIDYVPGSADRGDFDATSTAIALTLGESSLLPRVQLEHTFERYWNDFMARRSGAPWEVYTPYELRNISAFVRLGWRARAHELLQYFLADQRPAGWNQWAEVVGRVVREPRFLGDMPHAWIASDFIRAVLDLFAYERAPDGALVIGAGVPDEWLKGEGIAIEGLRTGSGTLTYRLKLENQRPSLFVDPSSTVPPARIVPQLAPPQ